MDPDGDDVRCRWANGSECMSICMGLPYATIDYVSFYFKRNLYFLLKLLELTSLRWGQSQRPG